MKYTDPSGHSWFSETWKKLKKWTKKNWRTIVTIAVVTVATIATGGFGVGSNGYGGVAGRTTIMAVVSGTVSEATGGKFANGAVSGAFIHMFNDYSDRLANRVAFGDRKPKTAAGRIVEKGVQGAILGAGSGFIRRGPAGALYGGVADFTSGIVKGMSDESHLNISSVSVHGAIKVIIRENLK